MKRYEVRRPLTTPEILINEILIKLKVSKKNNIFLTDESIEKKKK